jgi:hypothetical protein
MTQRQLKCLVTAALAGALLAGPAALAQDKDPAVPKAPEAPRLDPRACADLKRGDVVETDGAAPRDLTDQLARGGGVICPPPGLDPHIRAPAPSTESDMPVVPPPDAPGQPDQGAK